MRLSDFASTGSLNVASHRIIDHLRKRAPLGGAPVILPTESPSGEGGVAQTRIGSLTVSLVWTSPCVADCVVPHGSVCLIAPLEGASPPIVNGREPGEWTLFRLSGEASVMTCERQPRSYVAFHWADGWPQRGWAPSTGAILTHEAGPEAMGRVADGVARLFRLAASSADVSSGPPEALRAVDEALAPLDPILAQGAPGQDWSRSVHHQYQSIVRSADHYIDAFPEQPVYSADLAARAGVSVRTLQSAILRFRGMTLHRYVKIRRLWIARDALAQGGAERMVKTVALAAGFPHFGRFSGEYTTLFGEAPSVTLRRARGSIREG